MKKYFKSWLSIILIIALCIGITPLIKLDLKAKAEDSLIGDIGQVITDTASNVANDVKEVAAVYYEFGSYPLWNDERGKYVSSPLKWRVIQEEDNCYTLMIDRVLFFDAFGSDDVFNWKDSNVRTFLNDDFYNAAFTESMKADIIDTKVDYKGYNASLYDELLSYGDDWLKRERSIDKNAYYIENSTTDKVYVLSAEDYMNPNYGFTDTRDETQSRIFYFDPNVYNPSDSSNYPTINEIASEDDEYSRFNYYIDDSNYGAVWVWTRDVEEVDLYWGEGCPTAINPRGAIHSGNYVSYNTYEDDSIIGHQNYGLGMDVHSSAGIQPVIRVKKNSKFLNKTNPPGKPVMPNTPDYPNSDSNNQNNNNSSDSNQSSSSKSIGIYSTNPSYMLIKGQEMTLGFQLESNGVGDGIWRKMSYTISDPTVINVTDSPDDNFAYVKAKKAGKTNLTVFDSNSGISKTVEIVVTDPSSARMYPITMPDSSHFEINGMVIDNYSCTYDSKNREYTIKLNAYNYNYFSGAIDVFDSSGKYQGSNEIKGKEIPSDFNKLNVHYFLYLPASKQFGLDGNYKDATATKKTSVSFKVPQGGYFTISNNFLDSRGTFIYNGIDLAFDIMKCTKKVLKAFSGPDNEQAKNHSKDKLIKKVMSKDNEELFKEIDKKIQDVLKKRVKKDISKQDAINVTQSILRLFADYCSTLDYDLKKEMIDSLSHFTQKEVLGTAVEYLEWFGEQLLFPPETTRAKVKDNLFAVEKAGILAAKLIQINQSMDNLELFYYTDAYTQESHNSGIMVKGKNISSNVKVQAFRIYSPNSYTIPNYDDLIRNSVLYNITLVENDKTVQPSGKVQVQIPIPTGLLQDSCKVFREENDGTWTALDARRVGNHMVFETDHFSVYALTGEIEKLSIKSLPNKLNYNYYDTLDLTGLELLLGDKTVTDGYLCSPKLLTASGECEVTVTCGFAETTFKIHVDKNGFVLDDDGDTRYYHNNIVDTSMTDIVKDPRTGIWFNVVKGIVTPGATIAQNSYGWWYIDKDGKVDFTAQSVYQNKYGWWKTTNGKVTFKENGIFQNGYGWWRVKDSKVDFKAQGIYQNQYGWWKTTDGKVTFKENGVFQNENGWWKVKDSKVDFNFTGIASNKYGSWYIKNGKVDFSKNGKVKYNNKTYTIKNGKVA